MTPVPDDKYVHALTPSLHMADKFKNREQQPVHYPSQLQHITPRYRAGGAAPAAQVMARAKLKWPHQLVWALRYAGF